MSRKTRLRLIIVLLLCSAGILVQEKSSPGRAITLSKETTRVSGPLNEDGYVDYMQVINQRMSDGVTTENNANVLLWKAIGPQPYSEGAAVGPAFFKLMNTEMLPKTGDYFTPLEVFAEKELKLERNSVAWDQLVDQQETARSQVWTGVDYPQIAAWLEQNEKPLALASEASRRPRYYSPLISSDGEPAGLLISAWLPGAQATRELSRTLSTRAMFHLGAGRPEAAWEDLLACYRLGRLMAEGSTLVEVLVGHAIWQVANQATLTYIDHVKPNAKQAAQIGRQLAQLTPLPAVADRIDLCERFSYLDAIQRAADGDDRSADLRPDGDAVSNVTLNLLKAGIDGPRIWDVVLKQGNARYDELVKAMRTEDPRARLAAVQAFDEDAEKRLASLNNTFRTLAKIAKSRSRAEGVGQVLGEIMESMMMSHLSVMVQNDLTTLQRLDHIQVALALSAYHVDQGQYPDKLLALQPKYLQQVPLDRFTGKALIYRPTADGYLLYSVSLNGKDDQGRMEIGMIKDDVSIQMPPKSADEQD